MVDLLDFYALGASPLGAVLAVVLVLAASARLTRLVVSDTITRPYVESAVQRLHQRADDKVDEATEERTQKSLDRAERAEKLADWFEELTSCPWCTAVWTSTALVVVWPWASPSTAWSLVILVLAVSEFAAQIRYRE